MFSNPFIIILVRLLLAAGLGLLIIVATFFPLSPFRWIPYFALIVILALLPVFLFRSGLISRIISFLLNFIVVVLVISSLEPLSACVNLTSSNRDRFSEEERVSKGIPASFSDCLEIFVRNSITRQE